MKQSGARSIIILVMLMMAALKGNCQTTMPDVLNKNTLKEQMNYIEKSTRIYENYRAIREDIFQKMKVNVSDSLSEAFNKIAGLNNMTSTLNHTIDSLNSSLETTKIRLEEITRTKNSISILGLDVNKITYNTIMWIIIAGLAGLLVMGFLAFKRNHIVTINTRKELSEMKNEFEAYRKASREAREKMSMDHFNEIKKLKG